MRVTKDTGVLISMNEGSDTRNILTVTTGDGLIVASLLYTNTGSDTAYQYSTMATRSHVQLCVNSAIITYYMIKDNAKVTNEHFIVGNSTMEASFNSTVLFHNVYTID